ncbi:uncharacterized protein PADG_08374 [Paracoccidioides brasiliensis Pb18]|uniref:Amino-acid N-acetyltransferase subunit Mak10 n=1 Tax=Paracoccidioides brasiliensis (strain Pb18) TaxID=502780 RepID=C1GLY3_PARBD|nr:uncharacterized protein PADG_08374 [Paracoccidioides brasiliensis Pb18]EEH43449.2 hypothetical protein PADG_08374 [Paracoccidioides brasiliensis Pb18]
MDEKMDSGYLAPGETLDDDYDVLSDLLPEEVVGITDQLLCQEVAWHIGHPLSQTLFTSIYLDRLLWPVPQTLDEARFDRVDGRGTGKGGEGEGGDCTGGSKKERWDGLVGLVLRAYCLALIKACDRVISKVSSEYYHEDEDFVTQLYNRSFLADVDSSRIQAVLTDALNWLETQKGAIDDTVREALTARLIFRAELLRALDMDNAPVKMRTSQHFLKSLAQLSLLEKSVVVGRPVPEAFSLKIQRRLASTVPPRPMVEIRLADAMAHMKRFCRDAVDALQISEYKGPYNLQTLVWALQSRKPQPCVYVRSLVQSLLVNKMKILGSVAVKDFFFDALAEIVLPDSRLLDPENEEVEVPSDSRFQIAKHVDNFVKRAAQLFVDVYRTACLNRCRVRRTLCHAIVDWDALQAEAEDFDVHLRTLSCEPSIILHGTEPTYAYPLSSWAYHEKLRQMRFILQLGFELSIYSPEEMPGMYWYLSHLCATHLAHLDRIRSCVHAARRRASTPIASTTATETNKPDTVTATSTATVTSKHNKAYTRTLALLDRLTTELVAIDAFAVALHCLYVLLHRHSLLPSIHLASTTTTTSTTSSSSSTSSPPSPRRPSTKTFSSPRLRYELRMKPFLPISLPELVPYEMFEQEAALAGDPDEDVLERGLRAVAEAKKGVEKCLGGGAVLGWEWGGKNGVDGKGAGDSEKAGAPERPKSLEDDWMADMKDSLRACIAASIAIEVVKRAMTAAGSGGGGDGNGSGGSGSGDGECERRPKLNLAVEIPPVGSKGRWHDWWAVPRVTEVLPVRGGGA